MKILNPMTRECRIGVLGFGMSGKTVFLTSLLNHIKYHRPERFTFPQRNCQIHCVTEGNPKPSSLWEEFPYDDHRGKLSAEKNHLWPERTTDCSRITVDFGVEGWWTNYSLTFYDIPGERVADIAIYENEYPAWSGEQLGSLKKYHRKCPQDAIRDYLAVAEGPPTDRTAGELVELYKRALMSMAFNAGNNITPSTFLLDHGGKRFIDKVREIRGDSGFFELSPEFYSRLTSRCTSGLAGKELAPLGQRWTKEKNQPCVEEFQKNYKEYKDEIVIPLFGTLISCDALAVLIDIPYILQYRYPAGRNDANSLLKNIFRALKPDNRYLPYLLTLGFRRRIQRIAFIASQCDRFHHEDWDKLRSMTHEIARWPLNDNRYVNGKTFACSAVVSTMEAETGSGQLFALNKDETRTPFSPFRVPSGWKGGWPTDRQWEEYLAANENKPPKIPDTKAPNYPSADADAPEQHNLDAILQFLTGSDGRGFLTGWGDFFTGRGGK